MVVTTKHNSAVKGAAAGAAAVAVAGGGGVALYRYVKSRIPAEPDKWDIFTQYVSGTDSVTIVKCFLAKQSCFLGLKPCPTDIELLAYLCLARFNEDPVYYTEALRYLSFHGLNLKVVYDTYPTKAPIAQISQALKEAVDRIFLWEQQCTAGKSPPNGGTCLNLIQGKSKELHAIKTCLDTVQAKTSVKEYIAACKDLTTLLPPQQVVLTSLSVLASFAPIEHYNELFGFKLTTNEAIMIQALVQLNSAYDEALYALASTKYYSPVFLVFVDLVIKANETMDSVSMTFYAPRIQRARSANMPYTIFALPTFFRNTSSYPEWMTGNNERIDPKIVVTDPKAREHALMRIYNVLSMTHEPVYMIMTTGTFKFTAVVQCDAILLKLLNGNNTELTIGPKKLQFRAWVTESLASLTTEDAEVGTILKFIETIVPNLRAYADIYLEGDAVKITELKESLKAKFGWYSPSLGIKLRGVIGNFVAPTKADLLEILAYVEKYPDCQTRYDAIFARANKDLK